MPRIAVTVHTKIQTISGYIRSSEELTESECIAIMNHVADGVKDGHVVQSMSLDAHYESQDHPGVITISPNLLDESIVVYAIKYQA